MEKDEVIGCYNQGKHYVETCLKDIASLEQSNDKKLRQVLRGTAMVEVSYKAAENFVKVCGYVINGGDGAQKLKGKLYDLKEKVRQLYNSADKHNLNTIREISDLILSEIGEVEEWANDDDYTIQETSKIRTIPEKEKPLNEVQVKMSVKNDPFKRIENGKPIPYKKCYERLTEGKIRRSAGDSESVEVISKQYDLELFQYCVDRADISKIYKKGKKSYAILFMNDIASFYEDSSAFRKAAAKAFDVTKLGVGKRGTGINADYYNLMTGIFSKDVNYQKVKKKKSK